MLEAMVARAAARNESFCASSVPPQYIPALGSANAACGVIVVWLTNAAHDFRRDSDRGLGRAAAFEVAPALVLVPVGAGDRLPGAARELGTRQTGKK